MRIVSITGARPQFIKLAPLARALKKPGLSHLIVHTGQHYDYNMSRVFFDQLGIPEPDYHLGVGSGTHGFQTAEMLKGIERVLLDVRPRWAVVYGDTNSTLAGSLAAAKYHVPVVHVEAGLRSYNRGMPEEINRVLTDHVSSLLFCPTRVAVENLRKEGFQNIANDGKMVGEDTDFSGLSGKYPLVVHTGDIMCDALKLCLNVAGRDSKILDDLGLSSSGYLLATIHRAENTDNKANLKSILEALSEISAEKPVIFPAHPRTRKAMEALGVEAISADVRLIGPVSYLDMLVLEKNASRILTDSGGVQKEAFLLGVPCVTMRTETEWVETIESGWNTLSGPSKTAILEAVTKSPKEHAPPHCYGHGSSAEVMAKLLEKVAKNRGRG